MLVATLDTPAFPLPPDTATSRRPPRAGWAAAAVLVATVSLAVLAFPPFRVPEAAYALLFPATFWAYQRPAWRLYLGTMFAAQAIAWTVLLGWLHHVTWLGLLLLGPFIGGWVGVWFVAARWVMPRLPGQTALVRLLAVLGLAGGWVVVEWSRSWLLGGFPWLPLSASQWQRVSILQVAPYTGAYGISFVLVMMNLGFAAYAHRLFRERATGINKRSQEFFLALFLLLTCVSLHVTEAFNRRGQTVPVGRVAIVQPKIAQEIKWDPQRAPAILEVLRRVTLEAAASRPDLILWPEAVTPLAVRGDETVRAWVEGLVREARAPLVLGSIAIEQSGQPGESWRNGAFLVTPAEGVAPNYYVKRRLVPFGEYVPLRPLIGWIGKFVPIGGTSSRARPPPPYSRQWPGARWPPVRSSATRIFIRGWRGAASSAARTCWSCSPITAGSARAAQRNSTRPTRCCGPSKPGGPCCDAATPAGADGSTNSGSSAPGSRTTPAAFTSAVFGLSRSRVIRAGSAAPRPMSRGATGSSCSARP